MKSQLILNYMQLVNSLTGFEGQIEQPVIDGVKVVATVSSDVEECSFILSEGDSIVCNDLAIERLDEIERYVSFGIPAAILLEARRRTNTLIF